MLIVDVENAPVVCGSPVAARSFTLLDDLIHSLQRRLEVGALPSRRRTPVMRPRGAQAWDLAIEDAELLTEGKLG